MGQQDGGSARALEIFGRLDAAELRAQVNVVVEDGHPWRNGGAPLGFLDGKRTKIPRTWPRGADRTGTNPDRARGPALIALTEESGGLQLLRDLRDSLLNVLGLPCSGAHELAAAKEEHHDLRLVDAVHEARELLRFVLDLL